MPPRKRARSSPGSSSSSAAADAAPLVELDGGEPLPPKLILHTVLSMNYDFLKHTQVYLIFQSCSSMPVVRRKPW